jgi:hypothetical protein
MVRQKEADRDDPDEAGKAGQRNEEEKLGEDQVQPAELACGGKEEAENDDPPSSTRMKAAVTETPAMRSPIGMEKPGPPSP